MILASHRGCSKLHLENTMEAFAASVAFGIPYVELDVQLTGDGHLIVEHDSFDKETGVPVHSRRATDDDLLLREVLTRIAPSQFILDIKEMRDDAAVARALLALTDELRVTDSCVFCSFNECVLQALVGAETVRPKPLRKGLITGNRPADCFEEAVHRLRLTHLITYKFQIDASLVEFLHSKGVTVFTYTVNTLGIYKYVQACGVDGIISDNAELFM